MIDEGIPEKPKITGFKLRRYHETPPAPSVAPEEPTQMAIPLSYRKRPSIKYLVAAVGVILGIGATQGIPGIIIAILLIAIAGGVLWRLTSVQLAPPPALSTEEVQLKTQAEEEASIYKQGFDLPCTFHNDVPITSYGILETMPNFAQQEAQGTVQFVYTEDENTPCFTVSHGAWSWKMMQTAVTFTLRDMHSCCVTFGGVLQIVLRNSNGKHALLRVRFGAAKQPTGRADAYCSLFEEVITRQFPDYPALSAYMEFEMMEVLYESTRPAYRALCEEIERLQADPSLHQNLHLENEMKRKCELRDNFFPSKDDVSQSACTALFVTRNCAEQLVMTRFKQSLTKTASLEAGMMGVLLNGEHKPTSEQALNDLVVNALLAGRKAAQKDQEEYQRLCAAEERAFVLLRLVEPKFTPASSDQVPKYQADCMDQLKGLSLEQRRFREQQTLVKEMVANYIVEVKKTKQDPSPLMKKVLTVRKTLIEPIVDEMEDLENIFHDTEMRLVKWSIQFEHSLWDHFVALFRPLLYIQENCEKSIPTVDTAIARWENLINWLQEYGLTEPRKRFEHQVAVQQLLVRRVGALNELFREHRDENARVVAIVKRGDAAEVDRYSLVPRNLNTLFKYLTKLRLQHNVLYAKSASAITKALESGVNDKTEEVAEIIARLGAEYDNEKINSLKRRQESCELELRSLQEELLQRKPSLLSRTLFAFARKKTPYVNPTHGGIALTGPSMTSPLASPTRVANAPPQAALVGPTTQAAEAAAAASVLPKVPPAGVAPVGGGVEIATMAAEALEVAAVATDDAPIEPPPIPKVLPPPAPIAPGPPSTSTDPTAAAVAPPPPPPGPPPQLAAPPPPPPMKPMKRVEGRAADRQEEGLVGLTLTTAALDKARGQLKKPPPKAAPEDKDGKWTLPPKYIKDIRGDDDGWEK